ncbi:MAG TPA: hypothetical protein DCZ20_05720, partial [Lachnospiraceae bacterium]|nr:hypothetical protein [Lachnospiraceae bacterium]
MESGFLEMLATIAPIIIIVLLLLLLLAIGYVKASPDTAYIISRLRKQPKVLIGKAGIKIPFLEKKDELNLQLIPIDVKTSSAVPTADYINIRVDAAVNVKISDQPERLALAAQNFLNRPTDYIAQVSREVLEGNMREIVGKMNLEEMVSDRQKFATLVKENAEPLAKVDKITMYGDGNSSKLVKDIVGTLTQVTDGLKESTGVDLQSVLSGFLGAKLLDTK